MIENRYQKDAAATQNSLKQEMARLDSIEEVINRELEKKSIADLKSKLNS